MNIAQALKKKARLAGKVKELQQKAYRNNRFTNKRPAAFDTNEVLAELNEVLVELVELKKKIAKANVGISDKLVALSELKASIAFWEGFKSFADVAEHTSTDYNDKETVNYSTVTAAEVDKTISEIQKRIEDTQDEVDAYNAQTLV